MYDIKKAAVLGSGVMGAAIAAHLANAGLKVTLLDIVPSKLNDEEIKIGLTLQDQGVRNRVVMKAYERIKKPKSMLLYTQENINRITFGNLEDDLCLLREADLVVEVVLENLEIKKSLFQKISPYLKKGVILSSNTSGISINSMCEALSEDIRKNFIITHFFNPPRYMKLLEIVPSRYTDTNVVKYMKEFCEYHLGKGVVVAQDTPGFVANRVGSQALISVVRKMLEHNLTVEEVDALTGSEIGRPRSGTFRLMDLVGIDTVVDVAAYLQENIKDEAEKDSLEIPEFIKEMVRRGYRGDKSGQGFYKKENKEMLVIESKDLTYHPKKEVEFDSLILAREKKKLQEKLLVLAYADDRAGKFVWDVLKNLLLFSAELIPEVTENIKDIDNSMKWGYNWEVGPFELWDMIGVRKSVEKMRAEGDTIPAFVEELLTEGRESFYDEKTQYDTSKKIQARQLKSKGKAILANEHASLIDMGEDVACYVLHSPNSSITDEVIELTNQAVAEVETNYRGMVFASAGKNFCIGANLPLVLNLARNKEWVLLEKLVTDFQHMNIALKYCSKPVIAAPYAMVLGAGTEIVMHCTRVRASAETYMGLVEVGVGLLPGGGGTKEMLLRATEDFNNNKVDLAPFVISAFDTIARAKVSTSAPDAINLGYLKETDRIVMNIDRQLYQAKKDVLELADIIASPNKSKLYRVGGEGLYALLKYNLYQMMCGGFITKYDEHVCSKIALVLCGGKILNNSLVSEEYLLELEKEAFISLCGEVKTQERMEYMLNKGKSLRN